MNEAVLVTIRGTCLALIMGAGFGSATRGDGVFSVVMVLFGMAAAMRYGWHLRDDRVERERERT